MDGLFPTLETLSPKVADSHDFPKVKEMVEKFLASSPYRDVTPDYAAIEGLFHHLVEDPDKCIFLTENGFVCGLLTPLFFAPDVIIATEVAWWSEDGKGEELKAKFEDWARSNGATASQMTTLNNPLAGRLGAHLVANGYTPVEISYLKAL